MKKLFFGDNLYVLKNHIKDESVDLVYLDPPFNSNASYNILFKSPAGKKSQAQIEAFDDTWHWGPATAEAYDDVMRSGSNVAGLLRALRSSLGENDMMAYLTMMCVRLIELHRVLKKNGSLYLHCDPTASHYLKIILDGIFRPSCYQSEISWKRSSAHNDAKQGRKKYGHIRDTILFYSKDPNDWKWNWLYTDYDKEYVDNFYKHEEKGTGRKYRMGDLTAAKAGGDTRYKWRIKKKHNGDWLADLDNEYKTPKPGWEYDYKLPYGKRIWAYSYDNMVNYEKEGRIVYASTGMPNYKRYLDEMPGVPLQNNWDDIRPVSAKERLGYPTQKPLALLKRIIETSTEKGDVVLDPFCGCGTAVHAAESLGRKWIGIDVTFPAVQIILDRLSYHFPANKCEVLGIPTTLDDAKALAELDKFQFQFWVVSLVGGHSRYGKGSDQGIDGQFYFKVNSKTDGMGLISVKGGKNINPSMIRDLRGVIEREEAEIGVFISAATPTRQMIKEAAAAGVYDSGLGKHPRIQIRTIEELLTGKAIDCPPLYTTVTIAKETSRAARGSQNKKPIDPQEVLKQRNLLLPISGGQGAQKTGQFTFNLEAVQENKKGNAKRAS